MKVYRVYKDGKGSPKLGTLRSTGTTPIATKNQGFRDTPQEAIEAYRESLERKLDLWQKDIQEMESDKLALGELLYNLERE